MSVTTQPQRPPPPRVTHIARFERLFRAAAGIDVDKMDLRRYEAFVDNKVADFLQRACEVAKDNGRKCILPSDIPVTKGLAACVDEFRRLDAELALQPVFERAHLGNKPQLELEYDEETYAFLPQLIGGMSIALARSFKVIDPDVTGILTAHWDRAFRLFDLVW